MKKYLPVLLAAAVFCLPPALAAHADDYEGVVSGDSGGDDGVSVRDDGRGLILSPDYPQVKAEFEAGNAAKMKSAMEQDREAASQAREKEAAQEKAAIDARVKDTLSQPSTYDTRINNLQATTGPDGTVTQGTAGSTTGTSTTGASNTGTTGTGAGTVSGTGTTSTTTGTTYSGGGVSGTGGAGAAGSGGYDGLIAPENNKGRAQVDLQ